MQVAVEQHVRRRGAQQFRTDALSLGDNPAGQRVEVTRMRLTVTGEVGDAVGQCRHTSGARTANREGDRHDRVARVVVTLGHDRRQRLTRLDALEQQRAVLGIGIQ